MFTFNKNTGIYNVAFGNVPQKSKLQKIKQLIPDDQDPIFLVPFFPTGSVVVFDRDTGRYTRKDKGKQRIETDSEEEEEEETVDNVMADILDDVTGPPVVNTDDEEDEIYQLELQLQREMEQEQEEKEQEALVISRDAFIEKHNNVMAKGVVRAIREGKHTYPENNPGKNTRRSL